MRYRELLDDDFPRRKIASGGFWQRLKNENILGWPGLTLALICFVLSINSAFAEIQPVMNIASTDAGGMSPDRCNGQCGDTIEPSLDRGLVASYAALRSIYSEQQERSLVAGQARWLKLRGEACAIDSRSTKDFVQCIHNVDDERSRELDELKQIDEEERKAGAPSVDLEALLDKPMNLTAYSPSTMSAVYFDNDFHASRIPQSCRELYTLTAGAWSYTDDTVGMNSMGTAFGACQFMLFEAQARPPRGHVKIDFIDVRPYAGWLMCFALRCGDSDFNPDNPDETFSDMQKAGKLQIKSGRLPAWGVGACADMLIVDPPFFCLDGENVRMEVSEPADYTGSGQQQALLKVLFFPTEGTERLHYMLLATFDPSTRSIRVREIASNTRIKLILVKDES